MGFFLMIFSLLIGVFLIVFGISRRNSKPWYKIFAVVGIVLVLFAIYLGLPK